MPPKSPERLWCCSRNGHRHWRHHWHSWWSHISQHPSKWGHRASADHETSVCLWVRLPIDNSWQIWHHHRLQWQIQRHHNSCRTREPWFFAKLQDSDGPRYPGSPCQPCFGYSTGAWAAVSSVFRYFQWHWKAQRSRSETPHWSVCTPCCSASSTNSVPHVQESRKRAWSTGAARNYWKGGWSYTMGVPIGNHAKEKWWCTHLRWHADGQQNNQLWTPSYTNQDDLIHTLNGATVFSKLDLRARYHQFTLAPESRYITTFATHKGLRRYAQLNFGTNSASEIFQMVINELIRDIPEALNISNDVIVFGKTQAEHDAALQAVFRKFAEVNLTLNKKKCEFNQKEHHIFWVCVLRARDFPWPQEGGSHQKCQTTNNDQWCEKLPGNGHILCQVYSKL